MFVSATVIVVFTSRGVVKADAMARTRRGGSIANWTCNYATKRPSAGSRPSCAMIAGRPHDRTRPGRWTLSMTSWRADTSFAPLRSSIPSTASCRRAVSRLAPDDASHSEEQIDASLGTAITSTSSRSYRAFAARGSAPPKDLLGRLPHATPGESFPESTLPKHAIEASIHMRFPCSELGEPPRDGDSRFITKC